MNTNVAMLGLLAVLTGVNLASFGLWCWLRYLVRSADQVIGKHTAGLYTSYLFKQVMEGRFFRSAKLTVIGNPERDPVIRAVRKEDQFDTIVWLASFLKDLPVNFVPYLV